MTTVAIVLLTAFICLLLMFLGGMARRSEDTQHRLEMCQRQLDDLQRQTEDIIEDIAKMGKSMQDCLDEVANQLNSHTRGLAQHQQAIDYLTQDHE